MKVSVLQYQPKLLDTIFNLNRIQNMLQNVQTDLLVLPELATSGYLFSSLEEVQSVAETVPDGDSYRMFSSLAKRNNCSIVYGFPERCGDRVYNSCALVNPDGSYSLYRKIHLFDREKMFFSAGDTAFGVNTCKGGTSVGMMICFDWQFPEAARSLALQGAEIICHPSNLVLPWCQEAMKTRSLENRVFSITANRVGKDINGELELEFTGSSQILSPLGEILLRLGRDEETVMTIEIDVNRSHNKQVTQHNNAFTDRRPEMYRL